MGTAMTPRLRAIVEQVQPVESAIDVGCDHAQVGIWLARHGVVRHMTVSDVNEGPLRRAAEAVHAAGLSDQIRCVRCDGLDGIPPQDAVIIAGMGGELIAEILRRAPWTKRARRLVLQPMTAREELRHFLLTNGYCIKKEALAQERDKLYAVLCVEGGEPAPFDEADLVLSDLRDPLAAQYLAAQIARLERTVRGMRAAETPDTGKIERAAALCAALRARQADILRKGTEKHGEGCGNS
mgnify:FL=1